MRYLLTHSLHNSWRHYRSAEDDGEARQEFLTTLRREQIVPNERMLKGRQFEDDVLDATKARLSRDATPAYRDCVHEVASFVWGGLWQERIYCDLDLPGCGSFLLYGRADVIKGPWIYDIKYTKYYDFGKYRNSIQHTAYMAGTRVERFDRFAYLVSNGRDVWREDYYWSRDDYDRMKAELSSMIEDINRDCELSVLYRANWLARND